MSITALLLLEKKAFDTVNLILLNKMNHYGIRGNANNLFASFLANRKQYVFLNHTQSNYSTSNAVFLKARFSFAFTIYINDISFPEFCSSAMLMTHVLFYDDNISNLKYKIKGEINAVNKW